MNWANVLNAFRDTGQTVITRQPGDYALCLATGTGN